MAEQLELQSLSRFNVNEGIEENATDVCRVSNADVFSIHQYAEFWTSVKKSMGGLQELSKASYFQLVPPNTQSFSRINYMPTSAAGEYGILQWPGIPPESLEKMSKEHVAIEMLVGLRVDDVLRYADVSEFPWRPGWQIKARTGIEIDSSIRREIKDATDFLINGGVGGTYNDPRLRDSLSRVDFSRFLAEITRSSLVFDGIAVWTEFDDFGKIVSFAPYPAQNIRLVANEPNANTSKQTNFLNLYANSTLTNLNSHNISRIPPFFAVAVDDTGNIIEKFTRYQLTWYVRNPRVDTYVNGYGFPEAEQGITLVNGFTNAIKFNADLFDKNAIPKGLLTIKGNFCYSEDTEVLTKRGWLTFDKVNVDTDEFATLNKENSHFEWQKAIDEKVWNPYRGKMYKITGRSLDMLITPEHKMLLQSKSVLYNGARSVKPEYKGKQSSLYNIMTADELYKKLTGRLPTVMKTNKDKISPSAKYSEYWQIPVTAEWEGTEVKEKVFTSVKSYNTITLSGDDYCALLGMYLSEGAISGSSAISISQKKNSKGWILFNELLTKMFDRTPYYDGYSFQIYNMSLRGHLRQFGANSLSRWIPDEIMNATPRQLQIFFDYLSLGDGYSRKHKGSRTSRLKGVRYQITTSSKRMRDQLQELAIKLGYSAGYSVSPAMKQHKFPVHTKPIAVGQDFIYEESYTNYAYYDTQEFYQVNLIGAHAHPFLIEPVEYEGYIGCVTVPNHTILVRRNGTTAFSMQTQRQFDALGRVWDNIQRGINNAWSLPALQLSEKGAVEVVSLEPLRKEPVYYANLVNLFAGALCVLYRIPVHRLGYKISGTERDSRPDTPKSIMEEDDIGLPVLLTHLEKLINVYLLKSNWPMLQFNFTGKSPKEDARLYEARMLSMSLKEKRRMLGDPAWIDLAESEEEKNVARWMDLAPVDPALAGIYQSIIAARAKEVTGGAGGGGMPGMEPKETPGARFTSKLDPAKSESYGHASGVRRDSAAEGEATKNPKLPTTNSTGSQKI